MASSWVKYEIFRDNIAEFTDDDRKLLLEIQRHVGELLLEVGRPQILTLEVGLSE